MKEPFITQYDTARARTFVYKAADNIELICNQVKMPKMLNPLPYTPPRRWNLNKG